MWKTLKSLKMINSVDFMQQNVDIKYIKCYIGLYTDPVCSDSNKNSTGKG